MKKCKNCKKIFDSGRSDKKFCNSTCKNQYHNSSKSSYYHQTKAIHKILKMNRIYLHYFKIKKKRETVERGELEKKGFNFLYHTHGFHNDEGEYITFTYDFGLLKISNNTFKIFRQNELDTY